MALDDGVVAREGFDFSDKDGRRPVEADFRHPDDDDFLFAPLQDPKLDFSQVFDICIYQTIIKNHIFHQSYLLNHTYTCLRFRRSGIIL